MVFIKFQRNKRNNQIVMCPSRKKLPLEGKKGILLNPKTKKYKIV
jgi:hypothetical protein